MDINQLPIQRLKTAWTLLPDDKKAAIRPMIESAHAQLATFTETRQATHRPEVPHQLLLAQSALTHDEAGLLPQLPPSQEEGAEGLEFIISVSPTGEIYGTDKYQQLDPGWAEAAAIWLEHLVLGKHSFPPGRPNVITIDDNVTIALAGDWGTGPFGGTPGPSEKVAQVIANAHADYTIHLGDVYYAGTGKEETNHFVDLWPAGSKGSFALNSNHEMYSGGGPYFKALSTPKFSLQNPYSFFALENSHWVIVGLDSAYFSSEVQAYLNGSLGNAQSAQMQFLRDMAASATQNGKKVIILTHHNGLAENGASTNALWDQVMSAFPQGTAPAYWYWGHVHAAAVYQPQPNGTLCRCAGHGALPWGFASDLNNPAKVAWFEQRNANDPSDPVRVLNGCAILKLAGPTLTETFLDENGGVAYP